MELSKFSDVAQKILRVLCWGNLCYWFGGMPTGVCDGACKAATCGLDGVFGWLVFFRIFCYCLICHHFYPAARYSLLDPLAKYYPAERLGCSGRALNHGCRLLHLFARCFHPLLESVTWMETHSCSLFATTSSFIGHYLVACEDHGFQCPLSRLESLSSALAKSPHNACGLYEHIQTQV